MKHVLLRNPRLQGWQYGVLRALENAIQQETDAEIVEIPEYGSSWVLAKAGHGMRFDGIRKLMPKKELVLQGDVLWCVMMGPENLELDLFKGWEKIPHRILYLFDTYPAHIPMIGKLFSNNRFTLLITAFDEAKQALDKITGRPWLVVEHAAAAGAFKEVPLAERSIAFSSYGRRFNKFHDQLLEFCQSKNLYYDYSNHDGKHPIAKPEQLYEQYCWHVNHSIFNICWPVEVANPALAGGLHPVTCRWFEASSAGAVPVGKKPANPLFEKYIFDNVVMEMDPEAEPAAIREKLDMMWSKRDTLLAAAEKVRKAHQSEMSWNNRVKRIIRALPDVGNKEI